MESKRRKPAHALTRAVDEIRNAKPSPSEVEGAAARVWARVSEEAAREVSPAEAVETAEAIRGCDDYQSLIPDYLARRLTPARTLLLEDHSRECFSCRRALTAAQSDKKSNSKTHRQGVSHRWQWAAAGVAATLLLAVGVQQSALIRQLLFPIEIHASAQTVRGDLYRVSEGMMASVQPGADISARESIRTGSDSGAIVQLDDGSRIEMRERSQIAFVPASDGVRVQLERGSVIVRAAKQRSGHLYVSTDDVDVVVVGTVFSVSEGARGARVSVIEGEVRVEHGAAGSALYPGEQYNSSEALTPVPVEEEISWSQEIELHIALLQQFSRMRGELRAAIEGPGLRYSSSLVGRVPADTVMYAAFPNLARTLTDAYDVFERRIGENPITSQWWAEMNIRSMEGDDVSIEDMIEYVRTMSNLIGDEVVLALNDVEGDSNPLLLAEVTDAGTAIDLLRGALAATSDSPGLGVAASLGELQSYSGSNDPVVYIEGGLIAFSPSVDLVIAAATNQNSGFESTDFYSSLADAYADGASWLFAADIQTLVGEIDEAPEQLGFNNLDNLVVDYKVLPSGTTTRAVMNFDDSRSGIASWIGDPAPMGGLEFVSPDAYGVVAGLTQDPTSIIGDIFEMAQTMDPEGWTELLNFQQEHGIDIQYDLAEPMGGEFVLAIDGPMLPTPAWKAIAEVYDSARLQNTIDRMVAEINRISAAEGGPTLQVTGESVGGLIYHTLSGVEGESGVEVAIHYTYYGGYIIAGPTRALVGQAIEYNQTRYTLADAIAFNSLMPAGGSNDCSAILYQNMTPMLSTVASFVPDGIIAEEQLTAIGETIANTPPTLACVIGEDDRIVASNQGDLAFNLATLGGFSGLLETLQQVQK